MKKSYEIKHIGQSEWYILSKIYLFGICIWHFDLFDGGFPYETYTEARLERNRLERIEEKVKNKRNLFILIVITLILLYL